MNSLVDKLKDHYLTIFFGVLVGIPAWGIMLPQIFSVLSTTRSMELSSLFKVFTVVYFTLPFFSVFLLIIFQLKDRLNIKFRSEMVSFIILILIVMALVLLLHSQLTSNFEILRSILLYVIFLLGITALIRYVQTLIRKISDDNDEIRRLLDKHIAAPIEVAPLISSSSTTALQPGSNEETPNIESEIQGKVMLINFGIFFLFIPVQWIIALLMTINHQLYNSLPFLILCLVGYFLPFLIYKRIWQPVFLKLGLKERSYTSNNFIPGALRLFPFILFLILFFSRGIDFHDGGTFKLGTREAHYKEYFTTARELSQTTRREMELLQIISDFDKLQLKMDSIRKQNSRNLLIDSNKWLGAQTDTVLKAGELYQDLPLQFLNKRLEDSVLKGKMTSMQKHRLLQGYHEALAHLEIVQMDKSTNDLFVIALQTQRTGIIVFVSTLFILLFILFMLFFKDDKYGFSESDAINRIRGIISITALLIIILLYPLVKNINKGEVKAYQSAGLFRLANWNLGESLLPSKDLPEDSLNTIFRKSSVCCCNLSYAGTARDYDKELLGSQQPELTQRSNDLNRIINIALNDTSNLVASLANISELLKEIITTLSTMPTPPIEVEVKNFPSTETLLNKIDSFSEMTKLNHKDLPTKREIDSAKKDIVSQLSLLNMLITELNKKGAITNKKLQPINNDKQ